MKKYHLLAPGPTPIPPEVLQAIAQPILHHRTHEFEALFGRVRAGLAELVGTRNEVMILAASGTGALEAAGKRSEALSSGPAISDPGSSHGQVRRAFQYPLLQTGVLPSLPEPGAVQHAISERAAVGCRAARDRPLDAHEFRLEDVGCHPDRGVAVATEIDERQMRRQIGIGKRSGLREVARARVLERRPNAVPDHHVDRGFGLRRSGPVDEIHATKRHVLGQPMLGALDAAG